MTVRPSPEMPSRRRFVGLVVGGAAALVTTDASGVARAQDPAAAAADPNAAQSATPMLDETARRPVRRPPKPNARPQLTADQRDDLEHQIKCQCGCTLDVYTCRTTDFSCSMSPAMHRDVQSLVDGGYSADEIIDAFVDTYGETVLMAPKKEGFNWAGYIMPFAAMGTGAVVLAALIRRWGARAAAVARAAPPVARSEVDATPDELARLDAAVRAEDA